MNHYRRIFSGTLAAAMLLSAIPSANAASSAEIKEQISALEAEQASIAEKMDALQEKENANWDSTEEMVDQKNNIDQQIFLLYSELHNLDEQIAEYRSLISQNQQELNEAQDELAKLNEKNKERIRAMEEGGKMSYWSVVFKANNFTDLLDRMSMMQEIAAADKQMLASLDAAVARVTKAQDELVVQKAELDESRAQQMAAQEALETKRAEADDILMQLNSERRTLEADHQAMDEEKNALLAEIAQAEKDFNAAQAREEQARREEEERRKQEAEANKKPAVPDAQPSPEPSPDPDTDSGSSSAPPSSSDSGWLMPCSYIYISSPYGDRGSGWHNGVDFAASYGTPIYATRSGTVTRTRSMTASYGNHVVVNHGDGFSSLYAHMDYYVVSEGQYVSQGELIGYVGSTGNSTGPHLHLTIMYDGDDVNPMNYL